MTAQLSKLDARPIPLKERLIVALDVPSVDHAERVAGELGDSVVFYKVGMQLQFAPGGLDFARRLLDSGKRVFLDAKLFDIDETIERAVENVARMGVSFLTVHGNGKTIKAAVKGRGTSALQILSVTVLTSLDAADIHDLGFTGVGVKDLVLHRVGKALDVGADGVVASGEEVEPIRKLAGRKLKIVTPGIRRASDAKNDRKRIATPAHAIGSGADHLVVGRPITQASSPRAEAEAILTEIEAAL